MKLTLQRDRIRSNASCTGGELTNDVNAVVLFTLELPERDGLPGSAIPAGVYPVVIAPSPRFGRLMPHIMEIPNRSEILIHWGNYVSDTEGCVLVGNTKADCFVGESRLAFDALYPLIEAAGGCTIEVIG